MSNGHSQKVHKLVFKTDYRLMQVESIAECSKGEHSAILLTFIKLLFVIKIFVLSIFEWPFFYTLGAISLGTQLWIKLATSLNWIHFLAPNVWFSVYKYIKQSFSWTSTFGLDFTFAQEPLKIIKNIKCLGLLMLTYHP